MLEETLRRGLEEMHLACDNEILQRFRTYYDLLEERNRVMNLTAISGEDESATRHFLDSAAPLLRFPLAGRQVIDVGSGAGFPGLPLRILEPDVRMTLLDAQRKRVDFLAAVCDALGFDDVRCLHARAEELTAMREQFDYALARAVARLNLLAELCLPYVKVGGAFLALKGPGAADELTEAERALRTLGGSVEEVFDYALPGEPLQHKIVVIRKVAPTPKQYPRRYAQIKKSPL
jgi:16S rRNA (guanine527-N7)-methyltransferase